MMNRKGFVHTLEATFIAVILLTFVLGIIPAIEKKENIKAAKDGFTAGLSSLDRQGNLRSLVYAVPSNLSAIRNELAETVTKRIDFTVGTTTRNTTQGTIDVSDSVVDGYQGNYTYMLNSNIESAFLTLTFTTADEADFYLNGELIGIREVSSNITTLDLSDRLVNGTNEFTLIMPEAQSVSRKLDVITTERLIEPPQGVSVNVITYFVAGTNATYDPREIRVYVWNQQ